MPTLLELAGVPIPDNLDGQSLAPILRGETQAARTVLHGEHATCYDAEQGYHFLTDGRMKYIWRPATGQEQLFDLLEDPLELHDLSLKEGSDADLAAWRERMIEQLAGRTEGFSTGTALVAGREYNAVIPHAGGA
jgi:arylsulfatase A-like enzyme